MNLLELQVLAVVSRIPGGNDAPSPDVVVEPFESPVESRDLLDASEPAPRAAVEIIAKQPA